jgi:hypothetical protein
LTDFDFATIPGILIDRIGQVEHALPGMPGALVSALNDSLAAPASLWFAVRQDGSAAWLTSDRSPARLEAHLLENGGALAVERLPPGVVQVERAQQRLKVESPAALVFDIHAPRLPSTGVLEGLAAVRVEAGPITVGAELRVPVWKLLQPDGADMRLRLFRDGTEPLRIGSPATGRYDVTTPLVQTLATAFAGHHPLERLYALIDLTGNRRWAYWAEEIGSAGPDLEEFRSRWLEMSRGAALAVWRAADQLERIDELHDWSVRINHDLGSPQELDSLVRDWLEADPGFRTSPVLEWIEAVAGENLDEPLSPAAFSRLRLANRHLHSFLNDEARIGLLHRAFRWASAGSAAPREETEPLFGLARRVAQEARPAAAALWESRLASLLQSPCGREPLYDATVHGPLAGATLRRLSGGDLDPLFGGRQPGISIGFGRLTHRLPRRLVVEVHLPFCDRYEFHCRTGSLETAQPSRSADGPIFVERSDPDLQRNEYPRHQIALALTGAWRRSRATLTAATYTLSAGVEREFPDPAGRDAWLRLLDYYGFPADPGLLPSAGSTRCSLTLSLPGELAAAWTAVPPERDNGFLPLIAAVSTAVQNTLRHWIPALYLHDVRQYANVERTFPLLVWSATRPFQPDNRTSLTYDIFDHGSFEKALRTAYRYIPALFRRVRSMLEAAGDHRTAQLYDPDDRAGIVNQIRRRPRNFRSLLVAETYFVTQFVQLAVAGQHIQPLSVSNPVRALHLTAENSDRFATVVQQKLRRLYGDVDFSPLAGILLLEASAALNGGPGLRQAVARVHNGSEGWIQVALPRARRLS